MSVSNGILCEFYNFDVYNQGLSVGIVISGPFSASERISKELVRSSLHFYYPKMYKVFICDRIILLKNEDIQEKLN